MHFVAARNLQPGMVLAKSIMSRNKSHMIAAGLTLTERYVEYLQTKGYLGAYIKDDMSEDVIIHETVSPETIEAGINAVATGNVAEIINVSRNMVGQIRALDVISVDLFDLRSYDDYTYHHSVNVSVYAVAVGKIMGLREKELEDLAIAALCHDIGKNKIPTDILNKNGRLTDEEFTLIKNHAKYSYDILYDNDKISAVIRQAVLMHHENENGTGYPLGRSGKEIPIFAKIIHAVDVYDALTSKRPYKDPYSHIQAHEYLEGGVNTMFAQEVVEAVRKVVPAYPPGVDVRLSNGEEAIVLDQTNDMRRPLVRIKDTGITVDLSQTPEYQNIVIVASGISMLDYVEEIDTLNENRSSVKDRRKRVMIVDDSSVSLMQTKAAVGQEHEVIAITSGIEAIKYIKEKSVPDLIIMDVEMPVVNGISAVRSIRDNGYTKVPVIFLTASCDRETVLRGKEVGASDYIIKPANPTYLKQRVQAILTGEMEH